ncbi:hypothetical protein COX58_00335 [archaeon CG_4_10_14_0_2_um_filter_Archaea_38_6]|nr:MAG: hypothetical protein COS83_05040 [archaeon CG07_land_8_20_14_0_80_38_8]PJA23106.1 MAG: hypothetical protein COX58_00335 [archaeon CG_4_10_14_0_2_um_filter_Archaea_38_6]
MKYWLLLVVVFCCVNFGCSEMTNAQALAGIKDCILDVQNCDCSIFEGHESECESQVSIGKACLMDLTAPECNDIDLSMLDLSAEGAELKAWIEDTVHSYLPSIESCVNLEAGCDCSQFPKGIDEYCENFGTKQSACLNEYDLEACNFLENQDIEVFPSWTPAWVRTLLEPLVRPLVEFRQEMMRSAAIGSAMASVGECFADPYNCDCSSINYYTIRSDCEHRADLMKNCLDYRDCALNGESPADCEGKNYCTELVNMPLVPEATPDFMKPLIEPIVLQNVCPMMTGWPYDYGNYAACE